MGNAARPIAAKLDRAVDMKTPPKTQVDTMPAAKYFAYAAELVKLHPPHLTDEPLIERMKRIGIERGKASTSTGSTPRSSACSRAFPPLRRS